LCSTASVRDALELGGRILVFHRGRVLRELTEATPADLIPGSTLELVVRTDAPRELAAALAAEAGILGLSFSERDAPGQLGVRGADLDALARSIARAAHAAGIRVRALAPSLPTSQTCALRAPVWRALPTMRALPRGDRAGERAAAMQVPTPAPFARQQRARRRELMTSIARGA
jgi:hypothetical protein